jgi:sec-independent protein translocase protein TatC
MARAPALLALSSDAARGLAYLGLSVLIGALIWMIVYRGLRVPATQNAEMTYLEHAEEARRRILRAAFSVVFWFTFFLTFRLEGATAYGIRFAYPAGDIYGNTAAQLFTWIATNSVPPGVTLVVTKATEAVAAQMAVSLLLAAFLSIPALFHEFWGFFAPALRPVERRALLLSLPASILLFVTGAAFAFLYVIPLLLGVLYQFAAPLGAVQLLGAGALVGTVATMLLLFGLAFQLPLVMGALSALGVVKPRTWLTKWRHATVLALIVAAVMTDPTLITQLIVGACLVTLYWIGVGAAFVLHRKPH